MAGLTREAVESCPGFVPEPGPGRASGITPAAVACLEVHLKKIGARRLDTKWRRLRVKRRRRYGDDSRPVLTRPTTFDKTQPKPPAPGARASEAAPHMRMSYAVEEDFMTLQTGRRLQGLRPGHRDLVVNIFLGILALAILYALWTLASRYLGGRDRRHQDPEVARLLLKQAQMQCSSFELFLERPDGKKRKLDALLVDVGDRLEMELSRLGELPATLKGRGLECVFKLQDMRVSSGGRSFAFTAQVTEVVNRENQGARFS